jgi:hypothetical protein
MPHFERYIGIDYSGAVTPESSCKGLRVYVAEGTRHAGTGSATEVSADNWPGTHPGFSISKMRQRRVIFGKRLRCGERLRQSGEDGHLAF